MFAENAHERTLAHMAHLPISMEVGDTGIPI